MINPQNTSIASQGSSLAGTLVISRRKQILFSIIASIGILLCLEISIRVGAYFLYGMSPYFLFYGLTSRMADDNPEGHSASFDGYFKFPPNRVLHQYGMFRKPTSIRINSLGFRGTDFSPNKPEGTFRVICLGGSSTFGFFNRDHYTYPAILERLLVERSDNQKIEVINAGIPHANSGNVLAMLKGELLSYDPDVITIYLGYNDAVQIMDAKPLHKFLRWMHSHSATYVALKRLISAAGGPELYSKYARYRSDSKRDYVTRQIELHVNRYGRNIREIVSYAEGKGIRMILIKQAVDVFHYQRRDGNTKMRYQEAVLSVQKRLEESSFISGNAVTLLVHYNLMQTLETVANKESIRIVDNISILDEHPEYYASYVHLTEGGNRALAEEVYDAIFPYISP